MNATVSPPLDRSRREFLRDAALAGALVGASGLVLPGSAENGQADLPVAGKHPGLLVHAGSPAEIETPLELLRKHAITPKELLFVRNNQQLTGTQTTAPFAGPEWQIEFTGLVQKPHKVDFATLRKLPIEEVEMVLQCSGNGRYWFAQAAPAKASDKLWQCGALANVKFEGTRLAKVFETVGLSILPEAKFMAAEGADVPIDPQVDDFEHSLPLDDVLRRSLVVWRMNGEELPAVHGGPIRLVTPGFYGTMHVKWLSRLRFEAEESNNYHHERRYRTPKEPIKPGSAFQYSLANSESNWRMKIKSILWQPLEGERLPADRPVTLSGVAWNDGACAIEAIEVSSDQGQTWKAARFQPPESPYAWYPWFIQVTLPRGPHQLWVRAVDALGRTQPLDGTIHWNPSGYAWNGVHRVNVNAE